eukprot:scaffold92278_cov62-Phaeocystis_antarctica.AAC.1
MSNARPRGGLNGFSSETEEYKVQRTYGKKFAIAVTRSVPQLTVCPPTPAPSPCERVERSSSLESTYTPRRQYVVSGRPQAVGCACPEDVIGSEYTVR